MQSKAPDVDTYLKGVPEDRRPSLKKLRQLCLTELKGYNEAMVYGLPCYERNKIAEVGFASQKNFIVLYILKQDVMEKNKELLKGRSISMGKGCIRFSKPDKINFEVVQKMLSETAASTNIICG